MLFDVAGWPGIKGAIGSVAFTVVVAAATTMKGRLITPYGRSSWDFSYAELERRQRVQVSFVFLTDLGPDAYKFLIR